MVDLLVIQDTISHGFELDQGRRGYFPFAYVVSVSKWAITTLLMRWRRLTTSNPFALAAYCLQVEV